jgi:short-subunit dehydrogenase
MPNAIITGATQGIGKAIAEKLLKEGFAIAICARTESDLLLLKQNWSNAYPASVVHTFVADFGIKNEVKAFAGFVLQRFNTVDMLVNNAGIFYPGALATEPDGHLEKLMEVNLYSAYHLTRALLPVMKAVKKGHIFNLCSVASLKAYNNGGAYSITKYALLGFSENLRHELMADGIKVTALMPGATWSRSWQGAGLPEDRLMKAEDIADAVWMIWQLSPSAVVEQIVIRPLLGDI